MPGKFWQRPVPQELPVVVKNTLMSQFRMTPESVEQLRFLGQPGANPSPLILAELCT